MSGQAVRRCVYTPLGVGKRCAPAAIASSAERTSRRSDILGDEQVTKASIERALFDLMKQYWMDPCTAVVRPYSPAELQAHNLCAAVPPMIFMFALVGFVSLMAYLQSRGEQQKQKKS